MKGYIFEYYKYVRYTKDSLEDLKDCLAYDDALKSVLTFGDYDRLKINIIEDFARYRDMSVLAKRWIGNRHSILLYELEKNPAFEYKEVDKQIGLWKNGQLDDHLFWALTEFPFQSISREDLNYEKLIYNTTIELKSIINEKINEANYRVDYQIYGTLGTFGIVVLWMADQFTDVLNLVNAIKQHTSKEKEIKKFLSARTLFSKNPLYNDIEQDNEKLQKLQGKAIFQTTLKKYLENENHIPFYANVSQVKAVHTPGEYDAIFEMEAKDAYYLFENNEYFNHDTGKYQGEYFQTKVTLAKELNVDKKDEKTVSNCGDRTREISYVEDLNDINSRYQKVRSLMEKKFVKTAGLIDTLDSLICDYRSNVVSAVNENWANDFSYIFSRNLECIEQLLMLEDEEGLLKRPTNTLLILRMILNNLKQQIFHIAEAHSLDFENPKCHLRYTGHEDGLMFCYMGIIKEILETAYKLEGYNMQSEIVPVVTADVVPIIESDLYFDKTTFVSGDKKDQNFKILALNLPHVSFYEIPVYFQYMYHEIFHYIVPKDREERDYNIGIMLSTILMSDIIGKCFRDLLNLGAEADRLGCNLLQHIYMSVVSKYPELHKAITGEIEAKAKKADRDVVLFVSGKYKEAVISYLQEIEKNNFVKECLKDIGERLNQSGGILTKINDLEKIVSDNNKMEQIQKFFSGDIECKRMESMIADNLVNWKEHLGKFLDSLKEVAADLPMIELTNMPLSEYLLFYVNCLKNIMVTPNKLDVKEEVKEYLRVGVILDYYSCNGQNLDEIEEEFIYKFVGKYFHMHEESPESLRVQLADLKFEADEWIRFFKECEDIKRQRYGIFLKQLRDYCNMVSVKNRMNMAEIQKKSEMYFGKYRNELKKYAEAMKGFHEDVIQNAKNTTIEKWRADYSVIKRGYSDVMFEENLKLFQHFQQQKKLKKLYDINAAKNKEKANCNEIYSLPELPKFVTRMQSRNRKRAKDYTVSDFESLAREIQKPINLMRDSVRRLFGKNDLRVWYRGQENAAYGLIPSIARRSTYNKARFNYLAQYQRFLFGEFKFRSDGATEMHDRSHFSVSDYLALMQHYGVYTNLMDWSENAFTALYFALEKVLTHKENDAKTDAALWIFSPQLYNEARKYMISNEAAKTPSKEPELEAVLRTGEGYDGMIPNISLEHNEELYDMFLLGNVKYESSNKYGYTEEKTLKSQKEKAHLPLAVYTSRLNPRVQAQSGIFVAFNLYTEPCKNAEYDYMGLEKVQEYYLEHCEREPDQKEQFLYKIVIDKHAVKEIAECMENLGFNKSKIYPELSNIGERVR